MIKLKVTMIKPDYADRSHFNGQYAVYNVAESGPQIAAIVDHNIFAILRILQPIYNRNPERFMNFVSSNAGGIISVAHSCVDESELAASSIPEWATVPLIGYTSTKELPDGKIAVTYLEIGEGSRFLRGAVTAEQFEGLKRVADDYRQNPLLYYIAITRHHLKFIGKLIKEGLL